MAKHHADLETALSIARRSTEGADEVLLYSEVLAWKGIVSRGLLEDRRIAALADLRAEREEVERRLLARRTRLGITPRMDPSDLMRRFYELA